jgi:hypothetical protein
MRMIGLAAVFIPSLVPGFGHFRSIAELLEGNAIIREREVIWAASLFFAYS